MNNIELAELLIETAENILDESAGRNGQVQRYFEERAKRLDKENDEYSKKDKKKIEMYKRAGYADKVEDTSDNRYHEKDAKYISNEIKKWKDYFQNNLDYKSARNVGRTGACYRKEDFQNINTPEGKRAYAAYMIQKYYHNPLHKRINDREKTQNESIELAELLIETAESIINEGAVKTSKKHKLDNYLKQYNYQGDKKEGTITVDGKKYTIDRNTKSTTMVSDGLTTPRQTAALLRDNKIALDRSFEKLKNNKRRDAALRHEIAHMKYHNPENSDITPSARKAIIDSMTRTIAHTNYDTTNSPFNDRIHDILNKSFSNNAKKNLSKSDKIHDDNLKKFKKYEIDNPHSHKTEFDADAYAASNKNGEHLSRALRDAYKQITSKKGLRHQIKGEIKADDMEPDERAEMYSKENISEMKKDINKLVREDYNQRVKAMKDKSIDRSIYKEKSQK